VHLLAFDTSSAAVTVAVLEGMDRTLPRPAGVKPGGTFSMVVTAATGPSTIAERTEVSPNRQGELLAPMIECVLSDAGISAGDLSAIAVGLGPGPFTGLRVGIVTAKAMSDALGIPAYGVCSLDVIARRHDFVAYDHDNDIEHDFVVMTDARRKQVYWAEYDAHGLSRLSGPELSPPAVVADAIRGRITHVVGAGALLYRDEFSDLTVVDRAPYAEAGELAQMSYGKALRNEPSDDLVPLYLRRPDATPPGERKKVTPV
jgi:tRNA threonylcarbamoyl adenosine modification protein YeaZ